MIGRVVACRDVGQRGVELIAQTRVERVVPRAAGE